MGVSEAGSGSGAAGGTRTKPQLAASSHTGQKAASCSAVGHRASRPGKGMPELTHLLCWHCLTHKFRNCEVTCCGQTKMCCKVVIGPGKPCHPPHIHQTWCVSTSPPPLLSGLLCSAENHEWPLAKRDAAIPHLWSHVCLSPSPPLCKLSSSCKCSGVLGLLPPTPPISNQGLQAPRTCFKCCCSLEAISWRQQHPAMPPHMQLGGGSWLLAQPSRATAPSHALLTAHSLWPGTRAALGSTAITPWRPAPGLSPHSSAYLCDQTHTIACMEKLCPIL